MHWAGAYGTQNGMSKLGFPYSKQHNSHRSAENKERVLGEGTEPWVAILNKIKWQALVVSTCLTVYTKT